jgi:hypothetical protein
MWLQLERNDNEERKRTMAIIATDSGGGGDFTPVPAGTHFAVCCMVADLGKQRISSQMFGESIKHQVYIRWQIPAERVEWEKDGEKHEGPAVIGKTYTLSLGDKANLRKDLEAWRTVPFTPDQLMGFDISKLLGAPATLTVTHTEKNGKVYANVASLGGIPKGSAKPELEGEAILYDVDNLGTFEKLPKWLQEKVQQQLVEETVGGSHTDQYNGGSSYDELDDEIPF